ncbi:MAG TPA: hypothetical protein VFG74_12755 [Miltoncostaeaceae bacterium]|nr:hypothetical protein [Miltoncostaeaceae bacterium]
MGWSSANSIFDPVARALIDAGADDTTKRRVLGDLIGGLQDGDWDTEDESLEEFLDDPAVVAAFADRNVHLADRRCCRKPTEQVIADTIRAFSFDTYGMDDVDVALHDRPDDQEWVSALAAQIASALADNTGDRA